MKILQINTYLSGSVGKIVKEIYKFLGHEYCFIAYGKGPNLRNDHQIKINNKFFTKIDHLLSLITGLSGVFSNFATIKLILLIKKHDFDIIHLHNLHGYYLNIYCLIYYLKKKKIKTIWTLHDEFVFTGNCGSAFPCDRWKIGCGKCPSLNEYPTSLFFDWTKSLLILKYKTFANLDNIVFVAPSNWLASRMKKSILSSKKIMVIPNGIDCELFSLRSIQILKTKHHLKNEKIVLAVAPDLFDGRKGGEYVLDLAKALIGEPIKFILIGCDTSKIIEQENVIQIARTNDQVELATYYSLADTFVICSKSENFPTVCLESLACGTPIVGFSTGGTAETAPSPFGIFVDYGNLAQLEHAIRYMIEQKVILSSECRKFALANYSSQLMAQRYKNLYNQLADDSYD